MCGTTGLLMKNVWYNGTPDEKRVLNRDPDEECVAQRGSYTCKNVWYNEDRDEICVTTGILMKNVWYNGDPDEKRVAQQGS